MAKIKKTNALRQLDKDHIPYDIITYEVDESDLSGEHILQYIPLEADAVFKTLVLKGEKRGIVVCCIPCLMNIDLKKLASEIGDKRVEMLPLKDLLATTGYIRGGCSPIGMKKAFPTFIDEHCLKYDKLSVSAGQRGMQMIVKTEQLMAEAKMEVISCVKL